MGLVDDLRDKWINFSDWMDEKGIPKPLFFILILLLVVVAIVVLVPDLNILPKGNVSLTVLVVDGETNEPLEDATVKIEFSEKTLEDSTDKDGKAEFEVPAGSRVSIKAEFGDEEKSKTVLIEENQTVTLKVFVEPEITYFQKEIRFVGEDGGQYNKRVSFEVSCSNPEAVFNSQIATSDSGGTKLIEGIPSNCESLHIEVKDAPGVDELTGMFLSPVTSATAGIEVEVTETIHQGTVTVYVKTSTGEIPNQDERCDVRLEAVQGGQDRDFRIINPETGSTEFAGTRAGTYKAVTNCHGNFVDDESEEQQLDPDSSITFDLVVEPTEPRDIKVKIHTPASVSTGVKNVQLDLYDGTKNIGDCLTNDSGECTIPVAENKTFKLYAKFNGANIFSSPKDVVPQDDLYFYIFNPNEPVESIALIITVKDPDKELLEGVEIELFLENGDSAGFSKQLTDVYGKADFPTVGAGTYFAKAKIAGFKPVSSTPFTLIEDALEAHQQEIILDIGKGSFEFVVKDSLGEILPEATVTAINLIDSMELGSTQSDVDGMANLEIRMDKKPFFVASLPGFLPFVSVPLKPRDGTQRVEVLLLEKASALEVRFEGLGFDEGIAQGFVDPGQIYNGKVLLVIPNKGFAKAGIHFRAGQDETGESNLVEEDIVAIGDVKATAQSIFRSASFTPPIGSTSDLSHVASSTAKFTNIEWTLGKNGVPEYGVFASNIEVLIDDLATEGDLAKINYRGWATKANTERDPKDSVLGPSTGNAQKQGLYANTYEVPYSVGLVNLCIEGFCRIVSIEDLSTGSRLSVFDKFNAGISNSYKLRFTINKSGFGTIKNANLVIKNAEKGVFLKDYKINDAQGGETNGTVNDYEFSKAIGSLEQNKTFSGWIEFDAVKSGIHSLELSIESEKGKEFEHAINIEILPGREMKMEFVPKEIVPLIDNQMLLKFSEDLEGQEIAIDQASVSVLLNGKEVSSGFTDSDGVFKLELGAPSAGSKLKITSRKSGFNPFEKEIGIDDKILSVIPEKLALDMMPSAREEATIEFSIENATAVEFHVTGLTLSDELADWIKPISTSELIGITLKSGETKKVSLGLALTPKGIQTEKTVSKEGFVSLEIENLELNRKWISDLKMDFRILLGGELDLTECLAVEPAEWNINTYGTDKTITLEIRNECTVAGDEVSLRKPEVKISWLNENAIGKFTLFSDEFENELNLELKEDFEDLSDSIPAGFEGTAVLTFSPSTEIKSAELSPRIEFRAKYYSENGSEKIKESVKVSLTVNKLAECLQIVRNEDEEDLELRTAPYNQGWGLVQDYYDRDPYSGETETQTSPYNQTWPYSGYTNPNQSQFGWNPWQQQSNQWGSEEEEIDEGYFTLENACTDTVQVNLQASSSLELDETSFEIEPFGSFEVIVRPTSRIGRFKVKVRAKLESEQSFYKEVDSVYVKVLREDEISEKCKPIVEPTTFKANFFGWQESAGRIINRCVDLGYRLKPLTTDVFHCYRPDSAGTSMEGPCPLIDQVWSGTAQIQEISDGERIEVLEFGLKYNPHVMEQMSIPVDGTIEQRVGKMRVLISNFMNALESPGVISIPMWNPTGTEKFIPREVIFMDPFQWLSVPGMLISSGDPNKLPEECILYPEYFVLESWGEDYGLIGDIHFTDNTFKWKEKVPKREMLMPYAVANNEVQEDGYCGGADKIKSFQPTNYEDTESGVSLSFAEAGSGHHIVMTVDRSEMFTKCASVQTTLNVTIKRAFHNTEESTVRLPVMVNVLNYGVTEWTPGCEEQAVKKRPVPSWAQEKPCADTLTGQATYQELGFDRIKFNWRAGEISSTDCDPILPNGTINSDYIFCDATQFTLSLSKKFNEIREMVDDISVKLEDDSEFKNTAGVISADQELVDEINNDSGKLFHLFKKQLVVKDNKTGDYFSYFLGESDSRGTYILQPEKLEDADCRINELVSQLSGIVNNLSTENERSESSKLPDILTRYGMELEECYGRGIDTDNVLVLIPDDIDNSMDNTEQGADQIWASMTGLTGFLDFDRGTNYYPMSYGEFQQLHSQLLIQWWNNYETGNQYDDITITVGETTLNGSFGAWVELLGKLNSFSKFKIGIRNKSGLTERTANFVREYAADALDEDLTNLSSTELSVARLIKDNYSETFVEDFTNYYKEMNFTADQIEFKQFSQWNEETGFADEGTTSLQNPGEYLYRVDPDVSIDLSDPNNFSIVLDKILIKIAFNQTLEEISAEDGTTYYFNPFFYLPFDGEVGQNKANADYGVGFNKDLSDTPMFYSFDSDGKLMKPVMRKPGIITLTPSYSDDYLDTRSGTVLSVNKRTGTFTYTPSFPVAIKASWQEGKTNMLYYGLTPTTHYGNTSKMNELLVWWQEGEARSDSFQEYSPDSICAGWGSTKNAGKVLLSSSVPWNAVAFVPAEASTLGLEVICAKEPVIISATRYEGSGESTAETTGLEGGLVSLVEPQGNPTSIQDYVERIAAGEICVNNGMSNEFIELRWNPQITGLTDTFIQDWQTGEEE